MKKFLSFLVILGLYLSTNAQVIELVGIGMVDKVSETLTFSDPGSITAVTVGAIYKAPAAVGAPTGDVEFSDTDETYSDNEYTNIIDKNGDNTVFPFYAYWKADFSTVDASGITAIVDPVDEEYILSYYAYIYRDLTNPTYLSFQSTETVFFYRNGDGPDNGDMGIYEFEIDIPPLYVAGDIRVNIPISEFADDGRIAVIDIYAGGEHLNAVENTYNFGESFFLGSYVIPNVPAGTDKVTVEIYSPRVWYPLSERGDSFFVNGIVVDVLYGEGCTLTQGYWKNHADPDKKKYDETWDLIGGPDQTFFLSGQSYLDVMNTPVQGNAYYILAYQYIAAKLNFYAGANPSAAWTAFTTATALFETWAPADIAGLEGDDPLRQQFVNLGSTLDDYNNGLIGPGHCDDKSTYAEIETSTGSEMNIYPNPMLHNGTIDFTVINDAQTTVEMYNLMGQKVATLFDQPAQADQKYQVTIEANRFEKGLYVISLRNGSNTVTSKVNIN